MITKKRIPFILSWLVLFPLFSLAQNEPAGVIYSTQKGTIQIRSEAPLELIEASSADLKGAMDIAKRSFSFSIQNRTIRGFNSPLQQEHFYENYIEAAKYPATTFKGKIIEQVDFTADGEYLIRAKGQLNIHGVEQERIIKATLKVKNGIFQVTSTFTVPLSDHNITIPKIVYQKIAEEVYVTVNATFVPHTK